LLKLLETEKWYYPLLSNNGKFLLESVLRKKVTEELYHLPAQEELGEGRKKVSLF